MKKKIIIFILCICFIIPAMASLTACGETPKYQQLVESINSDLVYAKQHFEELITKTIDSTTLNVEYSLDEYDWSQNSEAYEFLKGNYIFHKTDSGTNNLYCYSSRSTAYVYMLSYNESDEVNASMSILEVENEECNYDYQIRNIMHAIYDIDSISAEAKNDEYYLTVKLNFGVDIIYKIRNNYIYQIYDQERYISLAYNLSYSGDKGINASPFDRVNTLWIDNNIDTALIDSVMLENIETIYLHQNCNEAWFIAADYEQESTYGSYLVYKRKTN